MQYSRIVLCTCAEGSSCTIVLHSESVYRVYHPTLLLGILSMLKIVDLWDCWQILMHALEVSLMSINSNLILYCIYIFALS